MQKYQVIYEGEVVTDFPDITKAMDFIKQEIHDCYSLGDKYYIAKFICVGSSDMPVSFSDIFHSFFAFSSL